MRELLKLLSSRVRVRLLDVFLSSPGARFYVRELERKTGEDIRNIHQELQNLEGLGLLKSEVQGKQKYYSVNEEFFLYPELKAIIFKTTGVQGSLKDALAKLEGIEAAFIYGSYATGDESERSDIDILIIGEPDLMALNEIVNELEEKLSREINYMAFDREEFEKRKRNKDAFITEVLKAKKIMLIGSEDAV
jgi:predicted nucleotidyltransferase